MVLFTKAITIQIELEVVRWGREGVRGEVRCERSQEGRENEKTLRNARVITFSKASRGVGREGVGCSDVED